jgi:streptomycin 6-kinase
MSVRPGGTVASSSEPCGLEPTAGRCDTSPVDVAPRLRTCIRRWQLEPVARLTGGFRSEVIECTAADGTEVVVKLAATVAEAHTEAAALTAWAHTGAAVRLIDADPVLGALLLERIRPGTPLPGGDDDPGAVQVAAGLLTRLHQAPPPASPLPALLDVYAQRESVARDDADHEQGVAGDPERGRAGLRRLPAARAAVVQLCSSADRGVLLHGDVLDKNLLRSGPRYVAIDPMPHIGDPCADVGFFAAGHPPATAILSRAAATAQLMGLPQHRALRWAAVWTVLQTCQAWRDDQADLEACLASRDFEQLIPAGS